eukprot:205875-Prymnesium_polylepis.1
MKRLVAVEKAVAAREREQLARAGKPADSEEDGSLPPLGARAPPPPPPPRADDDDDDIGLPVPKRALR